MARLIDGFLLLSLLTSTWAHTIDETKFKPEDIIVRDVAIVGGGASGTYAAVRLKDQGKTIALIERDDHLVRDNLPHIGGVTSTNYSLIIHNRAVMSTLIPTLSAKLQSTMVFSLI